jgi:predicted flap endonuclease-1-like 5' DNA nuclease
VLGNLRSVKSEALRPAGDDYDDLKRIRGIGVLIEKRLNSLGIGTYEQIANWTNAEIDRVSQQLDFKGRIERENWVEQARILSSGGQTEFSRRVDRGDVESSRNES